MKITITWWSWRNGQNNRGFNLKKNKDGYISKRALKKCVPLLKEINGKKVRISYEQ